MFSRSDFDHEIADIQALLGGTAPDVGALDEASRARLTRIRLGIIAQERTSGPGRAWWPDPPPQRRARLRIVLPATAVAAAVAVTAVLVSAPHRSARSGHEVADPGVYQLPAGARAHAGSAAAGRSVLLTAARAVSQMPAVRQSAPGRYWVSKTLTGNFLVVGPARDRYVILDRSRNQDWTTVSPKFRSPSLAQQLGVQFASASDEAAWRRDGSPRSWNVTQETSIADPHGATEGNDNDVTVSPGSLGQSPVGFFPMQLDFGGSVAQLLRFHADPAQLKALLLKDYLPPYDGRGVDADVYLFEMVPAVLALPVTPAVRSALYQMLASLPGVRSLGKVQDAAGQFGEAVALDRPYSRCGDEAVKNRNGGVNSAKSTLGSCVVEQRLVINPQTGMPLAMELRYLGSPGGKKWPAPDGLFSFELFEQNYWTNASPPEIDGQSWTWKSWAPTHPSARPSPTVSIIR